MTNNPTIDGVSRELLPCPLCGSSKVSLTWDVYDTDRGRRTQSQITCLGCCVLTKTFKSHAEARAYWNNRAAPVVERQEPVAKLGWAEIVAMVNEVLGCEAHEFPRSQGSIGHQMTGMNFNSLARVIDRVQRHATPQLAELQAEIESLHASAETVNEVLVRCRAKRDELQAEIDNLKNKYSLQSEVLKLNAGVHLANIELLDANEAQEARIDELQSTIDRQAAEIARLRSCLSALRTTAANFKEYAESGWDHFPDVGVEQDKALADATAALNGEK